MKRSSRLILEVKKPLLQLDKVVSGYGRLEVLHGCSLTVRDGEVVAIIGANGAGKSTLAKTISGLIRTMRGRIIFRDRDVTALSAPRRVELGIVLVPEGRQLFARLTVMENLRLGAYLLYRGPHGKIKGEIDRRLDQVFQLFPLLYERRHQKAGTLSGGEQQMVAVGRGLMSNPSLLILDEPSLGLAPIMVNRVYDALKVLRHERNLSILLIEQNANLALELADRGYLLASGAVALEGSARDLLANKQVKEIYLGEAVG